MEHVDTQPSKPLNVAVVRFPGSNCDLDTKRFFERAGHNAKYLWHEDTRTPDADLMVLPGGFANGDRVFVHATHEYHLDPGVQALKAPVMQVVRQWAVKDKRPLLCVCNGFQIAVHDGMLAGELLRNDSDQFFCDDVTCIIEGRSFFGDQTMLGNAYRINVAHGFGKYQVDNETYQEMMASSQIFMRYQGFNPNGSDQNIAGISNKEGNIVAMMPHPERTDPITRQLFLTAIENYAKTS